MSSTRLQKPVLVLNASYEPINICAARRALVLVLKGVAITEEEDGKRQEIYVKKAELFAKLEAVPVTERNIFEPLRAALEITPGTPPPPGVI